MTGSTTLAPAASGVVATLNLLTALVLAAALPLALVAAWGFRDAPFGRALRPVPVAIVGALAHLVPASADLDFPEFYLTAASTVVVLAALVAALEAAVLLSERRAV